MTTLTHLVSTGEKTAEGYLIMKPENPHEFKPTEGSDEQYTIILNWANFKKEHDTTRIHIKNPELLKGREIISCDELEMGWEYKAHDELDWVLCQYAPDFYTSNGMSTRQTAKIKASDGLDLNKLDTELDNFLATVTKEDYEKMLPAPAKDIEGEGVVDIADAFECGVNIGSNCRLALITTKLKNRVKELEAENTELKLKLKQAIKTLNDIKNS